MKSINVIQVENSSHTATATPTIASHMRHSSSTFTMVGKIMNRIPVIQKMFVLWILMTFFSDSPTRSKFCNCK